MLNYLYMARARDKEQLINFGDKEFKTLLDHLADLSDENITKTPVFDNRTVKDIIAHLLAWHSLFFTWYEEGMADKKPEIPAPGYTFKDTPQLNEKLYQDYKDMPWEEVLKNFKESHNQIMEIIKKHSDEELTTKKKYKWTGSTDMCSYFASATSSHYAWANDLIKKFKKGL